MTKALQLSYVGAKKRMIEWVDENVAIGNWLDARHYEMLSREGIDFIVDARIFFDESMGSKHRVPYIDRIVREADLMLELSGRGAKILVRCYHGRDRSPFIAMVYLSRRRKISYEAAYREVKKKRPITVHHGEWVSVLEQKYPGPSIQ